VVSGLHPSFAGRVTGGPVLPRSSMTARPEGLHHLPSPLQLPRGRGSDHPVHRSAADGGPDALQQPVHARVPSQRQPYLPATLQSLQRLYPGARAGRGFHAQSCPATLPQAQRGSAGTTQGLHIRTKKATRSTTATFAPGMPTETCIHRIAISSSPFSTIPGVAPSTTPSATASAWWRWPWWM
jgi:hypothetical protein